MRSGVAERVDCVVVGAGVVGLAVARALALTGRDVLVLEACEAIGTQTSARNSEVIHAGIYYATGSLKAGCACAARRCCTTTAPSGVWLTSAAANSLWPPRQTRWRSYSPSATGRRPTG